MFHFFKANFDTSFRPSLSFFGIMEVICTNGECNYRMKLTSPELCIPFAQTMDQPVCPCKW